MADNEATTCAKCGCEIPAGEGRAVVTETARKGAADGAAAGEVRCERCGMVALAMLLAGADDDVGASGEFCFNDVRLTWESAYTGKRGFIKRAAARFVLWVGRVIAMVFGDSRTTQREALERLVGKGGRHERDCYCGDPGLVRGHLCAYCHGRVALAAGEPA